MSPSMKRPTLLTMMLVPILVTITLGLVGFGAYIDRVESASRIADIDDELVRASATGNVLQRPPTGSEEGGNPEGPPPAVGAATTDTDVTPPIELDLDANGELLQAGAAGNPFTTAELAALAPGSGIATSSGGEYRVLVATRPDGTRSLTALPLANFNAAVADFRRALLGGGLVVILLEALVVWLVARTVSRPVTSMIGTATRIADGELETPIEAPSGSRETALLAADLERMLTRLRSTLDASESSATDARAARDQMERFLADVSHEFRTPLTALHGYSDLHAKGMLDTAGVERAMQRVGSESTRLNQMVNAMMQLARKGSAHTDPEMFSLAVVVADVVDDLKSAHPDRIIESRTPLELDTDLMGVPSQIHQAILNLAANACEHSDGDVVIELTSAKADLMASIIDHGPGIAVADRERIFQPFVRLDSSRTRTSSSGAGLGLALTSQIIAAHQGSIEITDTPGGGATIVVRLPQAALRARPGSSLQ